MYKTFIKYYELDPKKTDAREAPALFAHSSSDYNIYRLKKIAVNGDLHCLHISSDVGLRTRFYIARLTNHVDLHGRGSYTQSSQEKHAVCGNNGLKTETKKNISGSTTRLLGMITHTQKGATLFTEKIFTQSHTLLYNRVYNVKQTNRVDLDRREI